MPSILRQSTCFLILCPLTAILTPALAAPPIDLVQTSALVEHSSSEVAYTPPASYTGDVLNVTKCYCEAPEGVNRWGHLYLINYFNWHLQKLYSLTLSCNSPYINVQANIPICWMPDQTPRIGKKFPDHNVFSYEWNAYYFNNQKRGMPKDGDGTLRYWDGGCYDYCEKELGLFVANDLDSPEYVLSKTWLGGGRKMELKSILTSYTETDDMCNGCKKES